MAVSYFCFRGLWADEMLARQMRDPSSIWASPRAVRVIFGARRRLPSRTRVGKNSS
jgi:hypothetical protein